ncbi:MAG: hypothetical protein LBC74_11030 [Planctomycetaceae bacterium]|nr:hypothetical protein [Planctomycetaceae bacterium]
MSILSLNGYTAGTSANYYCPSCGRTNSTVTNIGQSYAISSGRASTGDSYICESCRSGEASKTNRSTYSATSPSASGICPLCKKQAGINTPHWSDNTGRTVISKSSSTNTKSSPTTVSRTSDSFR